MAWKTGRVHPGDRPALAYLEHGAPDGVPVMLIHSFASTGREFEPLFPALPPSIHAYAFTFHGHGEASEEGMGYTVPDLSDEIAAFMDAVGVESAVLVGASSGGYIAQWFAGEHPSRVRGLVTVGSPRSFRDKPAFARMQEAMLALSDPVAPDFARQFAGEASFPHLPEGYIEEMLAESCRIPASVWRATYLGLGESDVPSTTFRISVPALLLWGDQDHFLTRGDQEAMRDAILGARLVVTRGAATWCCGRLWSGWRTIWSASSSSFLFSVETGSRDAALAEMDGTRAEGEALWVVTRRKEPAHASSPFHCRRHRWIDRRSRPSHVRPNASRRI